MGTRWEGYLIFMTLVIFNSGLGAFSVMAGGSWGARTGETPAQTPVGMDAWWMGASSTSGVDTAISR